METKLNNGAIINFHDIKNSHSSRGRRLEIDFNRYQDLLDDVQLTDADRTEFLYALWTIIVAFIDLGFGVHPTQKVVLPNDLDAEILSTVENYFKNAA
jgi:hypothetical protein